jgi:WD40 repeat protein
VRFWDAATGRQVGPPLRHQQVVRALALSPDGRSLLSASWDRTVRLWALGRSPRGPTDSPGDARADRHEPSRTTAAPQFDRAAFSPDRRSVVLTSNGHRFARVLSLSPARPVGVPIRFGDRLRAVAFSPDGTRIATGGQDNLARLWDASTGRPASPPLPHPDYVSCLAFSPDGRLLATGCYDTFVRLWHVDTGRPDGRGMQMPDIILSVQFSPDGTTLVGGTADDLNHSPCARPLDVATGKVLGKFMSHEGWITLLRFRPDSKAILTGSLDHTARLWDARTGEPLSGPLPHGDTVTCAEFSPDGKLLATGSGDGAAWLRDAVTGEALREGLLTHPGRVAALTFSADGRTLLVGCADGSARLWDVATHRPLGPRVVQQGPILAVGFSADGRTFLTASGDGSARAWPLPEPPEADPERMALRLEVQTGLRLVEEQGATRLGAAQGVVQLDAAAWQERADRLRSLTGEPALPPTSPAEDAAWHEARAADAEQDGDTFAALWHLDHLLTARPDDWLLQARRGRALSAGGRLDQAAGAYARALQHASAEDLASWYAHRAADCEPVAKNPTGQWYAALAKAAESGLVPLARRQAILCLQAGDQADYRSLCASLLPRLGPTPDPRAAGIFTLGPDAVADWSRPLALAEEALKGLPDAGAQRHDALVTLAALLYRANRLRDAVGHMDEALRANGGRGERRDYLLLALIHHGLKEAAEARRSLDLADRSAAPAKGADARLEVELLEQEAKSLRSPKSGE